MIEDKEKDKEEFIEQCLQFEGIINKTSPDFSDRVRISVFLELILEITLQYPNHEKCINQVITSLKNMYERSK